MVKTVNINEHNKMVQNLLEQKSNGDCHQLFFMENSCVDNKISKKLYTKRK